MSHLFGEIRQIAFVVPNIDAAMGYWANVLGIGPFFIKRKIVLEDFSYRARSFISPTISIALANSGFIQIELIQQHDDAPSIYKEFIDSGRTGLQHMSSWMTCAEFDARKKLLLSRGIGLAQEGTIASSGVRLAYFDTERNGSGLIFEMADLKEPSHYQRVMGIAKAGESWDGADHVVESVT
ncbi:MAG: VOC family protein [Steroidobacteraceae bacterium]